MATISSTVADATGIVIPLFRGLRPTATVNMSLRDKESEFMALNGLPDNWEVKTLADVCVKATVVKRVQQDPDTEFLYLDIGGINNQTNKIESHKKYRWKDAPTRAQQIVRKNDVLFSTVRTYLKNIAFVDNDKYNDQIASSGFTVIRAGNNANAKYLFYYSISQVFLGPLNDLQTGSSYPAVRDKDVFSQPIPTPQIDEQERIVAKIEELFSELDAGVQSLKHAQAQLKTYRQSVLQWSMDHPHGESENFLLKDISEKIQIGPFGTQLHRADYVENGIPLINPMHIKDGRIVANPSYSITVKKRDSLANYILKDGDVILGRRGEMGRSALVSSKEAGWLCGSGSLYFRPKKGMVNSSFLHQFLQSQTVKHYLDENAGGTTMANLNLKIVGNIPICLPPINEQLQIVEEIESRLSVCDKLEESIEKGLKQSEALRQSILKQAFEGKLVDASIDAN